jgi:hypothetical protein
VAKPKTSYGAYHRDYYEQNKERIKAASRKRRKAKPDEIEDGRLQRMYGISLEDYARMLKEQGGVCKICKRPERMRWKHKRVPMKLTVDHCHATGRVRGLLCKKCNSILGYAEDQPLVLFRAAEYLGEQ